MNSWNVTLFHLAACLLGMNSVKRPNAVGHSLTDTQQAKEFPCSIVVVRLLCRTTAEIFFDLVGAGATINLNKIQPTSDLV